MSILKRERIEYYSIYKEGLQSLGINNDIEQQYAIWGVIAGTLNLTNTIEDMFPSWTLKKVYDLNVEGEYEGIPIERPNMISEEENLIYFVTAEKARREAKEKLEKMGKRFVFVDFKSPDWEKNF